MLGLAVFLPAFGTHGLNALQPASLGLAPDESWKQGLLMAVFPLAAVPAYVVVGPSSDRRSRRSLLLLAVAAYAAAHLLLLVSARLASLLSLQQWHLFLLLRLVAGIAGGAITVVANALGSELYPPERRGRSLSLVWLGVPLALVAGTPLPAYLAPAWSRLPAGLKSWLSDPYAAVAAACALFVLACVTLVVPRTPPSDASARREGPRPPRAPLRQVAPPLIAAFLMPLAVLELIASAATHTHRVFGFRDVDNGTFFVALGAASVAGGLLSSALADRLGKRRCLFLAQGLFALGAPFLMFCGGAAYVALATALGLVSTLRQGPFQALIAALTDARGYGRMSGLVLTSSALGTSAGQFLGQSLYGSAGIRGVAATSAVAMASALALSLPLVERPRA